MKKRLLVLLLCFFLTFQIGVIGYSQAVEAGEFVEQLPQFTSVGTGLLTLMALLGVTPEVATVAAIGGVTAMGAYTVSKFEEYARQELGYTDDTIPNFLEDIKDGVVSTVSDGFLALKEWIYSLSSSTSGTSYLVPANTSRFIQISSTSSIATYTCTVPCIYTVKRSYPVSITVYTNVPDGLCTYSYSSSAVIYRLPFNNITTIDGVKYYSSTMNFSGEKDFYATDFLVLESGQNLNYLVDNGYFDDIPSEFVTSPGLSDYIGAGGSLGDLTLEDINDLPLSGTDSISINLENINEKLGSIESVLERIIAGEIPLTKVRDTAGVVPVTKEDVLTEDGTVPKGEYKGNDDDLPPKVVAPSYDTDSFKVDGLQNVFPFCIPFDLINFIGVLKADPETPVFVINCSFLGKKFEDLTFTIDLKPFDPLAKICRYSELFLFCVGLIIVTRNIIKG